MRLNDIEIIENFGERLYRLKHLGHIMPGYKHSQTILYGSGEYDGFIICIQRKISERQSLALTRISSKGTNNLATGRYIGLTV